MGVSTAIIFLIANRFTDKRVTLFLSILSLAMSLRYIYWRATETLTFQTIPQMLLGSLLVIAEFYAVVVLVIGYFQTAMPLNRKPVPLPADQAEWPTIDVYIPTYNESMAVVRATSQQAGLAAAVAFLPDHGIAENAAALEEALARVRTGAVAQAAREDVQGRFQRGEAVGFLEDDVIAWGDPGDTLRQVLQALGRDADGEAPAELITVLSGRDAPLDFAAVEALAATLEAQDGNGGGALDAEIELRRGGQSAYWWLLAAE